MSDRFVNWPTKAVKDSRECLKCSCLYESRHLYIYTHNVIRYKDNKIKKRFS